MKENNDSEQSVAGECEYEDDTYAEGPMCGHHSLQAPHYCDEEAKENCMYQDGIAVGRDERQAERACPECEKTTNQTKTAETWECDGCGKEYDTFLV